MIFLLIIITLLIGYCTYCLHMGFIKPYQNMEAEKMKQTTLWLGHMLEKSAKKWGNKVERVKENH